MTVWIAIILAYALGAIPFSFLVARRVRGIDLREHGSGNLGATNVYRTLGPAWGVGVLLLDMAKGAAAVLVMTLAITYWPEGKSLPLHLPADIWRIVAGLLAAVGHTASPFMNFRGGKGVATTAGAYFVLAPYPLLITLGIFGIVLGVTRIVSIGSITAAAVLPFSVLFFEIGSESFSKTITIVTFLVCAWVIVKHRANIKRLQEGTEKRLATDAVDNGEEPPR
jgi:acyl phosphate:glycerol-3-phosphate acyltransferase